MKFVIAGRSSFFVLLDEYHVCVICLFKSYFTVDFIFLYFLTQWFSNWAPRSLNGRRHKFRGAAKKSLIRRMLVHGSLNQGMKFSWIYKSMLLSKSTRKEIISQKIFIFFINSDPNLTQTQILTLKLNSNLIIALSNTQPT